MSSSQNKTAPTSVPVADFLATLSERRRDEAEQLIAVSREITGLEPVMWGPSIIGFGSYHYRYATGREGDMPLVGFSPRKSALTVYISDGFDQYADLLAKLGKHRTSVSCLCLTKLANVDIDVLREIMTRSYQHYAG